MSLLRYEDDEVGRFHPAFEVAATEALDRLALAADLTWQHHPSTSVGVPDFVLVERSSLRWMMVVEIKRRRSSVFASRSQAQAKLYAEEHRHRFRAGRPAYFAVTNLEVLTLAALREGRPASECVVRSGVYDIGSFQDDTAATHGDLLAAAIAQLIERVRQTASERFDTEWPRIAGLWMQHSEEGIVEPVPPLPTPLSPAWQELRDYFSAGGAQEGSQTVLLHALLAAFLRGRLHSDQHPHSSRVPPADSHRQAARTIDALRSIDFTSVFDDDAPDRFLITDANIATALDGFLSELARAPRLDELAESRQDNQQLLEDILLRVYPAKTRAVRGKVQTDLELAQVLASLTIIAEGRVIDPCCGEGNLLLAAADRLEALGVTSHAAVSSVRGIEVDRLTATIAGTRLASRAGALLSAATQVTVKHEDMFVSASTIEDCDVVLMNPPFLRYERQRENVFPAALRAHFSNQIAELRSGVGPIALGTQPNLFNYFVEFVIRAARPGTRLGFVLDNKWLQNRTGAPMRELMTRCLRIEALVEYPHRAFFRDWDIATTLVVGVRDDHPPEDHVVRFVRSLVDPRGADLAALSRALHTDGPWPVNWHARTHLQMALDPSVGWKPLFGGPSPVDFDSCGLPTLVSLFSRSRRGSLEKEGGGTAAFAFPFSGRPLRTRRRQGGSGLYGTGIERRLTGAEERRLREAAAAVPNRFRGRGLRNADNVASYRLTCSDVEADQTLEPPALLGDPALFLNNRASWSACHEAAISEIRADPKARDYLEAVETIINLTAEILPDERRFVDLREPSAGELIIPRKLRAAHRVHINPFALDGSARQVKLSSNFVSYGSCLAVDPAAGPNRSDAVTLIASFLISSFGQLQFEMVGRNREGALSLEKSDMDPLYVIDPRSVPVETRSAILDTFAALPYPVSTGTRSASQPRVALDELWAGVLSPMTDMSPEGLLSRVYTAIDEWVESRQP